ncbi:hypothetical protein M422DRAFT_254997 [Sphaerobolus stellatus SS14]|uniref:Mid2 domain-containing protein n=1 Tax=Sphaerobolus stellatus (strain SS14) TaxID=990650 RepID=A0A0C9VTW7_SPHS4|nr:hypothetical protein M422DRAFT_254997 [Sphaerobolus stellatus SS14]
MSMSKVRYLLILLLFFFQSGQALTFSYTPPTECGEFIIKWTPDATGNVAVLLLAAFRTQDSFSQTANAGSNVTISTLGYPAGQEFVVVVSDSSGFASGGISELITVQPRTSSSPSCNTTSPSPAFTYDIEPNSLISCETVNFIWDANAIQPVTVTGVIPLGNFIQFATSSSNNTAPLTANVSPGTMMLFFLMDSNGQLGGVSRILTIGSSTQGSTSCLDSTSPHSTAQPGQGGPTEITISSGAQPGNGSPTRGSTSSGSSSSHVSGAVIGGAVGGGVAVLLGLIVALFLIRRRTAKRKVSEKRPFDAPNIQPLVPDEEMPFVQPFDPIREAIRTT